MLESTWKNIRTEMTSCRLRASVTNNGIFISEIGPFVFRFLFTGTCLDYVLEWNQLLGQTVQVDNGVEL